MTTLVYKVCAEADWCAAEARGVYHGSADDLRDGFIHFSTAAQLAGTLHKYYRGRTDLLVVAFDAGALGASLRFEPARGGELFPHLHGTLDPALARHARALVWDGDTPRLDAVL